jgi:hypothetical protein
MARLPGISRSQPPVDAPADSLRGALSVIHLAHRLHGHAQFAGDSGQDAIVSAQKKQARDLGEFKM